MARQRRGGFRTPELRGTLGTLLRSTLQQASVVKDALANGAREALERGASAGRSRFDDFRSGRRRSDALAELGERVLDLIRRGEIDLEELPEVRDVVEQLEAFDADDARGGSSWGGRRLDEDEGYEDDEPAADDRDAAPRAFDEHDAPYQRERSSGAPARLHDASRDVALPPSRRRFDERAIPPARGRGDSRPYDHDSRAHDPRSDPRSESRPNPQRSDPPSPRTASRPNVAPRPAPAPRGVEYTRRRDDRSDGTVSASTWAPPNRSSPSGRASVWRPTSPAAPADAPTVIDEPAKPAIPGQRRGGISFDDDDLADYMHPNDVPPKDPSKE